MARRRMFSLDIVDTDAFLDLPATSQGLYFHLGMRADDDGFVSSPKRIAAMVNASGDDLKLLIAKGFLIPFASGVCVIRDWKVNNYIQRDRYTPTLYAEEKQKLTCDNTGRYAALDTLCIQNGYAVDTQDRRDKGNISFSPDGEAYRCALFLAKKIHQRLPKSKPQTEAILQKWADQMDKLHRIDGYEWETIAEVLDFSQRDDFWNTVILSAGKFRKQFTQLMARLEGVRQNAS